MTRVTAIVFLVLTTVVQAQSIQSVNVEGVAEFGPQISEAKACEKAGEDAKLRAMRRVLGEEFGRNSALTCDQNIQSRSGNDCELFERTWAMINPNGFIRGFQELDKKIERPEGRSICRISAQVTIEEFDGKPDLSFESTIQLKQGNTLRLSDRPIIEISSNREGYHYVYYWAPNVDRDHYYRLFPNMYDSQTKAVESITIPSVNATKRYDIEVSLPADLSYSHEYLIVVSFKRPLIDDPPERVSEPGFFRWLKNFDRNQWTQSKYNYRVLGDSAWQT